MSKLVKKITAIALATMMTIALAGCGDKPAEEQAPVTNTPTPQPAEENVTAVGKPADGDFFVPGTYEATTKGFGGEIKVTVEVTGKEIKSVTVIGNDETPTLGGVVVKKFPEKIVAAQTPSIDAVAGATVTSDAVKKAVTNALLKAGADIAVLDANRKDLSAAGDKKAEEVNVDVVVVGAGGAGMTAAIKLKQAGKNVIILEKMPYAGGNTSKATGGMNAAETHYQAEQGITDSVQTFIDDTMAGGHQINNIDLVTVMAKNSAACIDWLDSIGAPLPKVAFSGGATNARIHAPADGSGVGDYLVAKFVAKVTELNIPIYYETKATSIIMKDNKAAGVMAESDTVIYTFNSKAVVLATGGFGANEEMYCKYKPSLKGSVTTNAPGATGDGIVMAEAVGAALVDIDQIQLHPTVEQTTSIMVTESVRGNGAILVNTSGVRFVNEMLTRDVVSAAELQQDGACAYVIFDQRLRDGLKAIEKYVKNGITVQADTIEGLAKEINVDPATLKNTLDTWNKYVADKNDPDFGRTTAMDKDLSVGPFYAIKIAPGIHHTMGGVKINTKAEVINTSGNVIPGLFAAGEVTGGVHGGNRIGGNAVADIVVFGNVAADSVVEYLK